MKNLKALDKMVAVAPLPLARHHGMPKYLLLKITLTEAIASGRKKIEYRSWFVHYRGPLVIVASGTIHADHAPRDRQLPRSCLVALVDLVDITGERGAYEWRLRSPRRLVATAYRRARINVWQLETDVIVKLETKGKRT